jgi:DNA replicative helicase MCM subunit Mcm2 (Cdc46/Mcm family)
LLFYLYANTTFSYSISDALSSKAFETLKKLAESNAKLCMRQVVSTSDVLAAITISEKYIKTAFENDRHTSPSQPRILSLDDIEKFKEEMQKWWSDLRKNIFERPL